MVGIECATDHISEIADLFLVTTKTSSSTSCKSWQI